jgi:HipA-like C-terminal domain/Protein of unknown function (DUF3631)
MVVFNVLACNTDAHAKNYSIMLRGSGASLAPMYDVMCGEVWESVTKNLAQKIAGKTRGDYLMGKHWQRFARECGLNPRQVLERISTLAKSAIAEAGEAEAEVVVMPAGGHPILSKTRQAVERRASLLLAQLHEAGDETANATDNRGAALAEGEGARSTEWGGSRFRGSAMGLCSFAPMMSASKLETSATLWALKESPVLSIDRAKHAAVGAEIRRQIESWAQLQPEITEWPFMPERIQDRDADVWEPLLAVADLVGGAETPTNLRVKSRPKNHRGCIPQN